MAVLHCCKGDTASQWEMAILGCQNSVTPEPIDLKFDTHDYVGELTSYAKFHKIWRHKD